MFAPLLLLIFNTTLASAGWEIISKTVDCKYDVVMKAKVGEKSIRAVMDGKNYVLFPVGNYVYMEKNPVTLIYDSYNRRGNPGSSPHFRYTKPGMASGAQSEVEITKDGDKALCELSSH